MFIHFAQKEVRHIRYLSLMGLSAACSFVVLAVHFLFGMFGQWFFLRRAFATDFVLLMYMACCILCFQRRRFFGAVLFTLGAVTLFAAADLKYLFHQEWLRISEFLQLDELISILPLLPRVSVFAMLFGLAIGLLQNFQFRHLGRKILCLLPIIAFSLLSFLNPQALLRGMEEIHPHKLWEGNNFFAKGVLFALAYDVPNTIALRTKFETFKTTYAGKTDKSLLSATAVTKKRNVHIFVMESFMDPNSLGLELPVDPIDPRMRAWFSGESLSPAYGGATAQAEFEILCGTPATHDLADYMVFNNLEGAPTDCLPGVLAKLGYRTLSMVAAPRSFYNYGKAYRSLGFSDMLFEDAFPGEDRDGIWISNDEHVALNKQRIDTFLATGTPILNYILTSSGHFSYQLNEESRPPILENGSRGQIADLANNLYYNSRSIADYVEYLLQKDPAAIIVVIGDHQGYIQGVNAAAAPEENFSEAEALAAKFRVPYLLLDAGQKKGSGLIAHYEIPHIILASLKGEAYAPVTEQFGFDMIRPFLYKSLYFDEGSLGLCPNSDDTNCSKLDAFRHESIVRLIRLIEESRMR